jgi:hypothetical protein
VYHDEFSKVLEQQGKYAEVLQATKKAHQLCEGKPLDNWFAKRMQKLRRLLAEKEEPQAVQER